MTETTVTRTAEPIKAIGLTDMVLILKNAWKFLLKKWLLLFFAGLLGGAAGFFYAQFSKVKYESLLTFSLEENSSGGINGALSLAAEFGLNIGGNSSNIFSGDNILKIIVSRNIIERVLLTTDTFNNKITTLASEYLELSNLKKAYNETPRLANISFLPNASRSSHSYLQDSILYTIYLKLTTDNIVATKPDKKLSIYEIRFTSFNERFVKIFTQRIIEETSIFYKELKSKKSKETLDILQHRLDSLKGSLNYSISSKAIVQDANINPAFSVGQVPIIKRQTDISVYSAAYIEIFKNLEVARINYLKDVPLLQIIDDVKYPMKKIKQGRLKTALLFAFICLLTLTVLLFTQKIFKKAV